MKLKTHKGISKRFKITKSGRVKYIACGRSHLLTKKKSKRKSSLRRPRVLSRRRQEKYIRQLSLKK